MFIQRFNELENIDDMHLNIDVNYMDKIVTKNLFMKTVLNELKSHPYYKENELFFSKLIDKLKYDDKHFATSEILRLLEENFKYKNNHKKKFNPVMNELMLTFHKKKFNPVMNELILTIHKKEHNKSYQNVLQDFKIFYNKRNRYNRYNHNHPTKVDDNNSTELFLFFFFIIVLLLKVYSFNLSDK